MVIYVYAINSAPEDDKILDNVNLKSSCSKVTDEIVDKTGTTVSTREKRFEFATELTLEQKENLDNQMECVGYKFVRSE